MFASKFWPPWGKPSQKMDKFTMHRLISIAKKVLKCYMQEVEWAVNESPLKQTCGLIKKNAELAMTCCRTCCRVTKSSCRWDWTAPPQLQENEMTKQNRERPARLKRLKAEQRDMVPGPWLLQAYPLICSPRLILFPEGVKTKPVATEMWAKFGGWWGLTRATLFRWTAERKKTSRFN